MSFNKNDLTLNIASIWPNVLEWFYFRWRTGAPDTTSVDLKWHWHQRDAEESSSNLYAKPAGSLDETDETDETAEILDV